MQVNKLTYKDICAHAEDAYRTLFDRKEWPPARHTRLKAPPAAFGNMATQSPELRYSTSSSPRPPTMVLDLPRKESVTSATSLDTGRANAQRTTRARAGMGMAMKDQRMSSPGSLLLLHLEHPSQASQWKGFQLVRKLQALDHYPRNGNAYWSRRALRALKVLVLQSTMSLAFDPSVWTTEIEVVPSVTDALFILRTMVTRILPYSFYCSPT
ncbi:hypothetical protein MHU86_4660 [Fragilaria crotonensis]|nr:hypothetical protein MHU86_4660 [Fragilaria crotonensis]